MNKDNLTLSRKFLGNTTNPTQFDKAHLKGYLKGNKYFRFGFRTNHLGKREADYHEVQFSLTTKNN